MVRKSLIVLIFVALLGITLSQVNLAEAGNQIKPTSPKVHPTPKPKPTSPKHNGNSYTGDVTYSGASRFLSLN